MLKPKFITFTGIDERTDMHRVRRLSEQYPIEWGILFSRSNQGKANRYPSLAAVHEIATSTARASLQVSAHICGRYSNEIMDGVAPEIWEFLRALEFSRTQINIADERAVRVDRAMWFAQKIGASAAIIQCRGAFPTDPRVHWLYDRSGGAGVMPQSWDAGAANLPATVFPGYAGGMGPETVVECLEAISRNHPAILPFWIDMEGRIRDADDWLDLDKCEAVAQAVYG